MPSTWQSREFVAPFRIVFDFKLQFNVDISSWDTSSVTTMNSIGYPTGCVGARRPTPQERLRLGALAKHEERDLHAVVTITFKVQSSRIR